MKFYLLRYRVIAGEIKLMVHHSEKDVLDHAITMMQSANNKVLDIHELNYGSYIVTTKEMQVIIESGRFKLEIVKKVESE